VSFSNSPPEATMQAHGVVRRASTDDEQARYPKSLPHIPQTPARFYRKKMAQPRFSLPPFIAKRLSIERKALHCKLILSRCSAATTNKPGLIPMPADLSAGWTPEVQALRHGHEIKNLGKLPRFSANGVDRADTA
jgi:hypothetical protein